jgi:hypothetical protein
MMKSWLRRIRGAVGMGLTWAFGWAVAGVLIGVASILLPGLPWAAFFEVFDAPLPALAVPGFFAGVFFSAVLGIVGRHRRFSELSLPRFAAWGAAGGVLLTLFPFALVAVGLASREGSDIGTAQVLAVVIPLFVLLSALSASVTLILARAGERRDTGARGEDVAEVGLSQGEERELLGAGSPPLRGHRTTPPGDRLRQEPANGGADA